MLNSYLLGWCDELHHKPLASLSYHSFVIISFHVAVVYSDQCIDPTEETLAYHMSSGTSPKGGVNAGKYAKITGKYYKFGKTFSPNANIK